MVARADGRIRECVSDTQLPHVSSDEASRPQPRQISAEEFVRRLVRQMENILRDAKLDGKRRQARHELLQLDPKAIAHLGLFGELDDKRYQKANTAMVKSMRRSADSLSAGA